MAGVQKLTTHVWAVGGQGTVNAGFIGTTRGALVVDSLDCLDDGRELLQAVKAEAGRITALIYTHQHGDHTIGASVFPPSGVIASADTAQGVVEMAGRVCSLLDADDAGLSPELKEQKAQMAGWDIKVPTLVFERRITLPWEPEVSVAELGGHTPGSTVVHIPAEKMLFAGDLVFNGRPAWFGDADFSVWKASLRALEGWGAEVVVPGHGPVGGPEILTLQREWLERFAGRMGELRQAGKTGPAARDVLVREFEFDGPNGYSEHMTNVVFPRALVEKFGFPEEA